MVVVIDTLETSGARPRHPEKAHRPDSPSCASPTGSASRRPGSPVFRETTDDRARARPRHGLRGGRLPEHRRMLVEEARHLHDHGRHLHARLRLLQRAHRAARRARSERAGEGRRRRRQARPRACRHHLGRPRRSRRRRRRAFRRRRSARSAGASPDDDRDPDAGLPAQGRRARDRGRGEARRLQPQSRNRAVEIPDGAARRALLPFDPPAAAGEGARSGDVHQVRHHGRPRRGAERGAPADGRSALGRRRLPHHRPVSPADAEAPSGRPLRHAGRVQVLRDHRLRQGLPDGLGEPADALVAPRRRGFRAAQGRARRASSAG